MLTLNHYQCEVLRKLGLHINKELDCAFEMPKWCLKEN